MVTFTEKIVNGKLHYCVVNPARATVMTPLLTVFSSVIFCSNPVSGSNLTEAWPILPQTSVKQSFPTTVDEFKSSTKNAKFSHCTKKEVFH